ncbi:DNA polymerase III subunit alpha [Bacillus solitudinis]|uniref:DNA polymerase III subunit alpha n=1 Tax=Bacillus solitudinis TaxID=2014074 RepID=UPI000C24A9EC|nr:DNA polymerase III subunit alpha [Bacillus solitudinis]
MELIHTHVYSEYSLLSSTNRIEALVIRAKELGFNTLALTDKNVMYGAIPFYRACKKHGLKPIIGLEVTIESNIQSYPQATVRLLAKNLKGYQNLLKIATELGLDEKNKSQSLENLSSWLEGCLVILPFQNGPLRYFIEHELYQEAVEWCRQSIPHQSKENWYIDIQGQGEKEEILNDRLVLLADKLELKAIVSNPVYFLEEADFQTFNVIQAIKKGETLRTIEYKGNEHNYYLLSQNQLHQRFEKYRQALQETMKLSSQCELHLELGQVKLPKYPLPSEETAECKLRNLCLEGVKKRFENASQEVYRRLENELEVITVLGYSDYFLIVWDFMNYARRQKILTGPGRGSAAGALVSYVLFITDVDPISYDLLFERFLNSERISLPDIDIDFPDHRRDEVISYVQQRYGIEHVAQILTFGTLAARASIRDVGKVIELDTYVIEQVIKEIPSTPGMTLEKARLNSQKLESMLSDPETKKLFDLAKKIEGLPRHVSTHAAGVIISSRPLVHTVALQKGQHGIPITQAPMDVLEQIGLLKFDFLGLRNLTLLERIVDAIKMQEGKQIDLKEIPLTDVETYKLLSLGDTTGVFQLESEGMRSVLRRLQPTEFEDIVAVNALFRPGPMEFISTYIQRKNGETELVYPHPDLEGILKKTYGVIVYQEQIMQIVSKLAGFTLAESDLLRRAISKKNKEALIKQEDAFVKGALAKGYEESVAKQIFSFIERFANYGFNRSHAVAYSLISYQLAYLKTHYKEAFYTALLSSVWNNKEKVAQYVIELKKAKITVAPPSLRKGKALFSLEGKSIRFGLLSIDHVAMKTVEHLNHVQKEKPFQDLYDLCIRTDSRFVSKRVVESMIKAGAMDDFGQDRAILLYSLDAALKFSEKVQSFQEETDGLFTLDVQTPEYEDVEHLTIEEKLELEKEVLGVYLSGHPVERITSELHSHHRLTIVEAMETNRNVNIAALIHDIRVIQTKKGEPMAFVQLGDETAQAEAVIFPGVWRMVHERFKKGDILFIKGKFEVSRERTQFNISKALLISELVKGNQLLQTLFLRITAELENEEVLMEIKEILAESHGDIPVILYYERKKQTIRLDKKIHANDLSTVIVLLKQLLGSHNVVLKETGK